MNVHIHSFQPGGAVADDAALEQFQKQWATYQKLVDTDAVPQGGGADPARYAKGNR
jgi:hypothetical protein